MDETPSAEDTLKRRQTLYREFFESPGGQELLADLATFCRAHESTFHPDARVSANLDGRREVWLRIEHYLQLDVQTLWKIYGSKKQ